MSKTGSSSRRHRAIKLSRIRLGQIAFDAPAPGSLGHMDLLATPEIVEAVCMLRPPIIFREGSGAVYRAIANTLSLAWANHQAEIQGWSDLKVPCLIVDDATRANKNWTLLEQSALPVLLGLLSSRETRTALQAIKGSDLRSQISKSTKRQRIGPLLTR